MLAYCMENPDSQEKPACCVDDEQTGLEAFECNGLSTCYRTFEFLVVFR